jgi:peptide/nickel transport system substrate-binding protein
VARALAAAIAVSLLAVSGAGDTSAQTPKRGGVVVVQLGPIGEPPCLRTWARACSAQGGLWPSKVLASAFTPGPDGWRPDLVSEYTLTKDPFTVTYHIRAEARWSDGVRVSAQDFVFARQTYLKYGEFSNDDPFRTAIRRVYAVDAKTVRYVFRSRYGNWRLLLDFPPLPRHALAREDLAEVWKDGIDNPKTRRPIGSGPFLVGPWERGRQVTLIRNPNYWGPHKAYLDRVVVRFLPVLGAEALRSGEADVGFVAPGLEEPLKGDPRFTLVSTLTSGWEHFMIRVGQGGHPALRGKQGKPVRRALAYGIDRVELIRALFAEVKPPPPLLDSTIYLTNERSYRPNWNVYRYRPTRARRLLEQAGCRRGADRIYECAGERLSLVFVTTAGNPLRKRTLEIVQAQLKQVGVEVVPSYVPNADILVQLPSGNFDVALFLWIDKAAPEEVQGRYRCGGEQNYAGYCSRLYTSDINQLERIIDPKRKAVVANRADLRMAGDVPVLPLYQRPFTFGLRKHIQGFVPNGFGSIVWSAENWWLAP